MLPIACRSSVACCSAVPCRFSRAIPATVMSTASLIALSAQATFCAPCICSANSPSRRRISSGSPNMPKGSSEDTVSILVLALWLLGARLAPEHVVGDRVHPVEEEQSVQVVDLVLQAAGLE